MGLDMYLYARKYVDSYDYERDIDGKMIRRDNLEWDKANALVKGMPTAEYGGIMITKCVAYWRKANAVHGWIVRNCANDVDECQEISLDREDLIKLRDVCLIALKDRYNAKPSDDSTIHFNSNGKNDTEIVNSILNEFKKQHANSLTTNEVATEDNPIPPTAGFFFGGTERDEYYYSYLAETVETINSILASDSNGDYKYYYQASW